jgi:hemoglobin/transferrin/lactoferrin receptor protein
MLLFFMQLFIHSIQSQSVIVFDSETNQPLSFVSVAGPNTHYSTFTNDKGKAELIDLIDADSIYFSLLGYKPKLLSYNQLKERQFRVYMEATDFRLDEVVVSSTRWAQSRRDLTQRVSSIRAFEVQLQNPQTAADLIGSSGEVFIQKSQQGGGSPMIRGFAANRLLIAVDGVRMNTAIFRSGNLQNIISIDPFAVSRAEVLFGPGSVMYGSDAIGGVMNFSLIEPSLSETHHFAVNGKAAFRVSSANKEKTGHVMLNFGGTKWAALSSISFNNYGDLRMGEHGPNDYLRKEYVQRINGKDEVVENEDPHLQVPSGFDQLSILQKIYFKPNEEWDFGYSLVFSQTSDYDRYDRLIEYRNNKLRSAEWYYGPQLWMMHVLSINHHSDNKLYDKMAVKLSAQLFEESRHDRSFNSLNLKSRHEKVWVYNLQADFNKKITERASLYYGLELIRNQVESTGSQKDIETGAISPISARYPESSLGSMGLFAGYQHRFNPKLLANAGLRYSHYLLDAQFDTQFFPFPFETAQINNGAFNGSAGLVYNPTQQWSLSTNFATGFRSPNVDDIGKVFDSEPGFVIVPNPKLKAEYARSVDIGLAHFLGQKAKVDLSAYYTLLTDALVRRPFDFNGADSILYDGEMSRVLAIQNAANARVYGIQGGLEIKLPANLSWYTSLSYQKGEEELDDGSTSPLRHAAPFFGRSRITYNKSKWLVELNANYSSEVSHENMPEEEKSKVYQYATDPDGNPYSPAWFTLNLKGVYKLSQQINLAGGIENITNQRYRPYSSGLVAPGRNFMLSATLTF